MCKILGVKLKLSTAYHPQTDGQTEIINQHMVLKMICALLSPPLHSIIYRGGSHHLSKEIIKLNKFSSLYTLFQHMAQHLHPYVNHYQNNWSEFLPMIDFAAASLTHESTGLSLFQIELGYEPHISFDWKPFVKADVPSTERLSQEQANQIADCMKEVWEFARSSIEEVQVKQKKQADKHRREIDFNIGDHVWVSLKNWETDQPSRKLDYQREGP
jgi:hypothetical protein